MNREQIDHDAATGVTLYLADDGDLMDPTDKGDGFIMAVLHRRYVNPAQGRGLTTPDEVAAFEARCFAGEESYKVFPLFMLDHSGTAYQVAAEMTSHDARPANPFSCPWDSGRVGSLFVKTGEDGFIDPAAAADTLCAEFTDFANGFGCGYVVEDAEGGETDSCWGFYGSDRDYCVSEGREAFERAKASALEAKGFAMGVAARRLEAERPDLYGAA